MFTAIAKSMSLGEQISGSAQRGNALLSLLTHEQIIIYLFKDHIPLVLKAVSFKYTCLIQLQKSWQVCEPLSSLQAVLMTREPIVRLPSVYTKFAVIIRIRHV